MCKGQPCDPAWLRSYGMDQTAREEEERMEAQTQPGRAALPATADELDARILARPLTFLVSIPEGYTIAEATAFKQLIREALDPVVKDAQMDIDSRRVQS